MSAKVKVLARHPEAISWHWADQWCIYSKRECGETLGSGKTAALAWADAASKLRKAKR